MKMDCHPLSPAIGAEVTGVAVGSPLAPDLVAQIRNWWLQYGILLFRGQADAGPDELISFSGSFGRLETHDQVQFTLPGYPTIAIVSNVKRDGRHVGATRAGRNWHSDSQYLRVPPSGSFLFARRVPPEGGDTLFASTTAAYDALPDTMKRRIEPLRVRYSRVRAYPLAHPDRPPLSDEEKANLPDVEHPLVRTHPETGCRALYVGGIQHGGCVVSLPEDESDVLLAELRDFATRARFVYRHRWRAGDAILWDNRSTLHCATGFDEDRYERLMLRTQLAGTVPQ
jgi:taurine dioxygenase